MTGLPMHVTMGQSTYIDNYTDSDENTQKMKMYVSEARGGGGSAPNFIS